MGIELIISRLKKIVGDEHVLTDPVDLLTYESDALTIQKAPPEAVVFPEDTAQVSEIVKVLHEAKVPFVPRGAGTGLSGGCLTVEGGVVIAMTKMDKILEIDIKDRIAVVEPGVVNQWISDAGKSGGFYYAPDPSSGQACTIGGNVAENAGGPHTMKYGVTVNHILGLEMVLPDGRIVQIGGKARTALGYDLLGIITGSEGTFGIVTKIIVNLLFLPQSYLTFCAVYDSVDNATKNISGLLKAGIAPAAMEMIDGVFIEALNSAFDMNFPTDAGAILIIELDGPEAGMETLKKRVLDICNSYSVRSIETAANSEERLKLWKARKLAFGAIGRISPSYYTQDGVVPRTKLPEILKVIQDAGKKYGVTIANAFHAGDGNIHPCLLYDSRVEGDVEKVVKASAEILRACVDLGGSISGEHGIGSEKKDYMHWIFSDNDLACMADLKSVFNEDGYLNPGKIFPTSRTCIETKTPHRVGAC